jgi:hypothetical protein
MTYPQKSSTVHVEAIDGELCLYDWQRGRVHALNSTAALVWQHSDGKTSPEAIALILRRELGAPESEALVRETLRDLARAGLLTASAERATDDPPTPTRRVLLQKGVAAALLPAIYSIAAPSPLAAQSLVAPTLASIAPPGGMQGTTVVVTLTGTHFAPGSTVAISGAGVTAQGVTVQNATTIAASFVIDAAAALGARSVTVTTPAGTTGPVTFTVNVPSPVGPTLTSIAPPAGMQGTTVVGTLTGTNFLPGSTVAISGAGVTVQDVTVLNATTITAGFVINEAAALGPRSVTATTTAGTTGPVTFTVNPPVPAAPMLTSIVPPAGAQGTTVVGVVLTGTNFVPGSVVTIGPPGGVTVQSGTRVNAAPIGVKAVTVTILDNTTITCTFVIDIAAALGPRAVTVTTPAGTTGPVTFTVTAPTPVAPTLTSIAPPSGAQGKVIAVTLTGMNFVAASTLTISGSGVTASNVTQVNATTITASFVIDAAAALTTREVTVTTPAGTSGPVMFTVFQSVTTFNFIAPGGQQNFTVPVGVTQLTVLALGAQGGNAGFGGYAGGKGGSVTATIAVSPGEVLAVFVGGKGGTDFGSTGGLGGFNGGGQGSPNFSGGGGGASDVRQAGTRVVVAGGGGGAGVTSPSATAHPVGGGGGGITGGDGLEGAGIFAPPTAGGGGGGNQSGGGAGGAGFVIGSITGAGLPGQQGTGGAAGKTNPAVPSGDGAGGGGGGFYGGGGGGCGGTASGNVGVLGGGGGGGSSFAVSTATGVVHIQGAQSGNGQVVITI